MPAWLLDIVASALTLTWNECLFLRLVAKLLGSSRRRVLKALGPMSPRLSNLGLSILRQAVPATENSNSNNDDNYNDNQWQLYSQHCADNLNGIDVLTKSIETISH